MPPDDTRRMSHIGMHAPGHGELRRRLDELRTEAASWNSPWALASSRGIENSTDEIRAWLRAVLDELEQLSAARNRRLRQLWIEHDGLDSRDWASPQVVAEDRPPTAWSRTSPVSSSG